jgi:hypothetical protein
MNSAGIAIMTWLKLTVEGCATRGREVGAMDHDSTTDTAPTIAVALQFG